MDDDFEDAFADELDALRDLEEDFYQPSQSVKKSTQSQGNVKHTNPSNHTFNKNSFQSNASNGKHSSAKVPAAEDWDVPEDLLADAAGFAEAASTADVLSSSKATANQAGVMATGEEPERRARKRDMDDLFGALSDSDNDLVIDTPSLPSLSPKPKRARKVLTKKRELNSKTKDDIMKDGLDSDFEITPPSSPTADEKAMLKVNMLRSRKQTKTTSTESLKETNQAIASLISRTRDKQRVLRRQPEGGFVSVTDVDGRRVYLNKSEKLMPDKQSNNKSLSRQMPLRLLSTSMATLKMQVERDKHERIIKEAERISSSIRSAQEEMDSDEDVEGQDTSKKKVHSLWVDKYAPRRYTELLSDDGVNRNLLFWLKLWDKVVFNRDKKVITRSKKQEEMKNKQPAFKTKWQQQQDAVEEVDDQKRPVHRIALLCGPPGLGKTTLAHVIARHAGYNVVEMNASDDRSQEVFRTKLENSIQMKSVLVSDKRPNCLVIDEIDGAPAPAINVLLNMIKKTDSNTGGKKKKKQQLLMRPIICICNDPYVPALRQLRQVAFVTHFPQTLSQRLATRLQQIARNNALRADMTSLMALCTKADNDIRSCLNTLQFLHSQGTAISLRLVQSLSVGQKDKHKGLFSVWQDIFQLPKAKRKTYANPHDVHEGLVPNPLRRGADPDETNTTSMSSRFYNILQLVQAEGEYEKLMQGVFENFLEAKFKDPHLDSVNSAYDWLGFFDHLQTKVNHSQNYTFMRYLPFTPVTFHMMFASSTRPQIKYPNTPFEVKTKQTRTQNLITTLLSEVAPRIASSLNPRTLVMDILSHVLLIIQPTLRPVNTQLFSSREKKQLSELIDTMIAYNLTYHQERSAEGQYNYVLDPNIEDVVRYSGAPPVKQMTYSAKQLIAREISLEKMRRTEKSVAQINRKPAPEKAAQKTTNAKAEQAVPSHKVKLKPKKIEENLPDRDFFGRIIQAKPTGEKQGEGAPKPGEEKKKEKKQLHTSNLWYKFNEGFCNAVRQTVRIQDLL